MRAPNPIVSATLACLLLSAGTCVRAAVFRCVDANGGNSYSDRPCAPLESEPPSQHSTGPADSAQRPDDPKFKKAARVLDLYRIAPAEPETLVLQRTVDDAAPDLVQALDPDNAAWTPANAKWHSVLEFVKADLRGDVQTALRRSSAELARITAHTFADRAEEADLDAVLTFLGTTEGGRYLALQSGIRPILYDAMTSLNDQEPVSPETPSEATLRQRQKLLSLALDYCIAKDGGGPPSAELNVGSPTVTEYSARHDGSALDALAYEYEPDFPQFEAFTGSPVAKRIFRALEPAVRTYLALSSTATTDFAEMELDKYYPRWRAVYGPPRKATARTTIFIRGRMIAISHTTQLTINAAGSPEGMAIACEQREDSAYLNAHRSSSPDNNAQAAALRAIQNRCRAEQRLPPY
jgi:hypothetical protein